MSDTGDVSPSRVGATAGPPARSIYDHRVTYTRIHDFDGEHVLSFDCGDLPADPAVTAAGHEPNGYFWEGVVTYLAPELADALELDSEAGMFSAAGQRAQLEQLRGVLEPVLSSSAETAAVIARAESAGFPFDD